MFGETLCTDHQSLCILVKLQEKLKELEEKVSRNSGSDNWGLERTRLRAVLEDKSLEVEQMKKEADMNADQMEHLRKEVMNFYVFLFYW
jgi:hypothetical protein